MKKVLATSLILVLVVVCVGIVFSDSINFDFNVKAENTSADTQSFLQFEQDLMDMNSDLSMDVNDDNADDNNGMKNSYSVSDDMEEDNDFSLKRLIVTGAVKNTYGAQKVASYDDLHILSYATVEETKIAYKKLSADKSLIVSVDSVVEAEQYAEKEYDYSDYVNWGAEAMDIGGYRQYLIDNKSAETDREVVVVVFDSGINTSHPMFEGRLLTDENGKIRGYSYHNSNYKYSYNNLAFDVDDPATTDINEGDSKKYSFEDDGGHGTHVAGIVVGLTPSNVKILPIKISGSDGMSYSSTMIAAYLRVVNIYSKQYEVVSTNLSFTGAGKSNASERDNFNKQCYNPLNELGILSVTSAGNDRRENRLEGLKAIAVSSLKNIGNNTIFDKGYSNYGALVDISAPGTDILSAAISDTDSPCESLVAMNGTSMASPQVAAIVALLRLSPEFKDYTAEQLENKLYEFAVDLGAPGKDDYYGNGMVNLKYFESVNTATLSFKEDGVLVSEYVEYKNVDDIELEVICSDSEFKIVYTTDGSMPTFSNGIEYTGAIKVDKLMSLQFIGYKVVDGQIVERTNLYTLSYAHKNVTIEDYFNITPDGVITNYIGDRFGITELVVPETIKGIVPRALYRQTFAYTILEKVTLPETIVTMGAGTFKMSKTIKYVYAPGVKELGNVAFIGCESIKFISDYPEANAAEGCYLPSLTILKGYEFNQCTNLESVYLPKLETITLDKLRLNNSDDIIHFEDCKKLASVNLPALTSVPADVFVACTGLKELSLASLTTLSAGMFDTCTKLTSVYLPALTSIPANIFEKCTELTGEFFLGADLHTIEPYALAGTKFTSFALASNNKSFYTDGVGVYSESALVAFAFGVTDINYEIKTEVEIDGVKHNVTIVGEGAMRECIMNAVTIPENILEVRARAFSKATINVVYYNVVNCPSSAYYDGQNVTPIFINVDTFVIGKKVEHIPSHFFKHSSYNFRNLVINSKATTFDTGALRFKNGLQNLILNFEDEIDKEYLDRLDAAQLFYSTNGPIQYFTSKSEMPMDQHTKFSAYSNVTRVGDYYVYSKESFEGKFRVEATFDKGGVVTPSGLSYYEEGASAIYNIIPAVGYNVEAILVDGVLLEEDEIAQVIENGYTFSNIIGNHTLHASFVAIEGLKIEIIQGVNGSIYRTSGSITEGGNATYAITPDAGYHIKHLIIDGEIVEASSEYTFENISANHTISAVFEANTDTKYIVKHWQQVLSAEGAVAVDGKYYFLVETDKLAGTTDTETNVVANDYVGFTALAFNQANIAGNGNAVIDIYYDRNEYSVFLSFGDELISATGDGVYLYGETVKIDAELQEDYKWIQWLSSNESLVANSTEMDFIFTMPAGEVTFTAKAEYVEYPYIAVKTLSLEREMTMVFYVDADALAGKENISLEVKKPVYADGNGEVIREEVDVVTEYTSANVIGKNMFRFVYGNLNAKEYGIEVTATLIADGRVKDVDTFSVREYAYGQLSKTTNVKFRTLLVDLLNYGAASQVYFNYNTNDLVNAGLTEEQKAYATPEMPEVSSKAEKIEGADGLVKVQGSSIALMKTIDSRIVFDVGCDVNDVFAIIYCYSISGNDKVMIVDGSQFEKVSGGDNRYQYVFSEYGATQMRDTFTIKFYRKSSGERIGDTYTYSIESYIAVALEKTTNAKFIALMDMMMKYGASAEAYFG